jgi:hypothetical protein
MADTANSLRSRQIARILDVISEGAIVGLVNGGQSVFLDGVPLVNANGSLNFSGFNAVPLHGTANQPIINGFAASQAEQVVGVQVKVATGPVTRSILDGNTDRCRLTVSVPALQNVNTKTGDVAGSSVIFDIHLQSNGGGYVLVQRHTITGKTATKYQRSITFPLTGSPPWDVRVTRVTPDNTHTDISNDLFWDSYTTIIDARVNYTLTAVVGVTIDSAQFSSIPKRTYEVNGLYVLIPSNYDPVSRTYAGIWDGNFVLDFTNNPAWVFFDLVQKGRYGLGDFITLAQIDKWALYLISQWCDGRVPDGRGGTEPRFVCNAVINTQQEAFDLVNALASVFRGQAYWAGGMMVPIADKPADSVGTYTNANVLDGVFNYAGADVKARHNMVRVSWSDPGNLGESRITVVEDQDAISRFGIQPIDLVAVGCTSEGQAIRTGKWQLFVENYEAEKVSFRTGLATAWARPGDVITIADQNITGPRRGGRVGTGSTNDTIWFDAPVEVTPGHSYQLFCIVGEGVVQMRQTDNMPPGTTSVNGMTVNEPFTSIPQPDTIWVISEPAGLELTLWRTIAVREAEPGVYEIEALRQYPGKWDYIEKNIALQIPDITNIGTVPSVTGLKATDYLVALSAISVGVRMLISWISTAPLFEVSYRPVNGNWTIVRTDQTALDVPAAEGQYDIWVTPINTLGRRGVTARITYTVIGRSAPPADPRNFRIQVVSGVALFQWAPATDLDVIIGGSFEMRYSPRTSGATWTSSNTVLTSIPGSATTAELPYRPGTYLLRTRDITGLFSLNAAVIVSTGPDTEYRPYYSICEQPDWLGSKVNTEIRLPQQWLVLGTTGGLWDDQPDPVDSWPTVDILPYGPAGPAEGTGTYNFDKRIDMGGVFPVRLTVDMLAFPFSADDIFIDDRPGTVDEWQDWDNQDDNLTGMVTVRVRQTDDDPASPAAQWTQWKTFIGGEYIGRGFEFQAYLAAPPGQNVAVEELCILADISAKHDDGADIVWVPNKMHITYNIKFLLVPAITIAIQEGVVNDTFRITAKTREGFDLELVAGSGAIITAARTFDWTAAGY